MDLRRRWRIAYWVLLAIFVLTAALNLLHVRAGFLTSHAADLFLPPWLYVVVRFFPAQRGWLAAVHRWLGRSPARAAGSLFVASALTELSQIAWPRGLFAGVFDPLDLLAFAIGLVVCFIVDERQQRAALSRP